MNSLRNQLINQLINLLEICSGCSPPRAICAGTLESQLAACEPTSGEPLTKAVQSLARPQNCHPGQERLVKPAALAACLSMCCDRGVTLSVQDALSAMQHPPKLSTRQLAILVDAVSRQQSFLEPIRQDVQKR